MSKDRNEYRWVYWWARRPSWTEESHSPTIPQDMLAEHQAALEFRNAADHLRLLMRLEIEPTSAEVRRAIYARNELRAFARRREASSGSG